MSGLSRTMTKEAMRKTPHILLWVSLLLFPLHAYAQGEQWQVGTTPSFSSGRYGTDTRTEVFYTPVTARRLFDNGDLTFVVPFTCIRGNGGVVIVNGMPVRQERLDAATRDGTRGPGPPTVTPAAHADHGMRPWRHHRARSLLRPSTSEAGCPRSPCARTSSCRRPALSAAWVPDGQTRAWVWRSAGRSSAG